MNWIDKIFNISKREFSKENSGHDFGHLKRVMENAIVLQKNEGGDLYVIIIASLVHDVHRLMGNETGSYIAPSESLIEVEKILREADVDETKINHILQIVRDHDDKDISKDYDIETVIVQDADIIDAVGEIGLLRTKKFCEAHCIPTTDFNYPLDDVNYDSEYFPISTCHYIYRTMIPQAMSVRTTTAKEIVKPQIDILKQFLIQKYYFVDNNFVSN